MSTGGGWKENPVQDQGRPQVDENTPQREPQKSCGDGKGGEVVPHENRKEPREGQFIEENTEAQKEDSEAEVVSGPHGAGGSQVFFDRVKL